MGAQLSIIRKESMHSGGFNNQGALMPQAVLIHHCQQLLNVALTADNPRQSQDSVRGVIRVNR